MSEVKLGSLVNGDGHRDAIHVAVVPMFASEMLRPGQRVGIVSPGVAGPSSEVVGIVDPYLTDVVPKGGRFWLCLLPNTVTGMRHEWQHPLFVEGGLSASEDGPSKEEAMAWLLKQCGPLGVDFEDLVGDWSDLVCGGYIRSDLNEDARDHWYTIQEDFWVMRKAYTGKDVPEVDRGGFTCSC